MATSLDIPIRLEIEDKFTVPADDIIRMVAAGVEVTRSVSWHGSEWSSVTWTFTKQPPDDGDDDTVPIDDDLAYLQRRQRD